MAQYLFPCVLIALEIICKPKNNPAQNFSILKFSFAKDWLLTGHEQACSRITRLFGWLFVCHHVENCVVHRKIVVDCTPLITSTFETLLQTRQDRELVQSVFCLIETGSCLWISPIVEVLRRADSLWQLAERLFYPRPHLTNLSLGDEAQRRCQELQIDKNLKNCIVFPQSYSL